MEVRLSKKIRKILANATARRQLSDAMEQSASNQRANRPVVSLAGKTYEVFVGPVLPNEPVAAQ
ncbi:MAG: hypothetical protein K1X71_11500 [Pirellulales bacterium]|nr:hypothetical protein [Pirellulales bacterium]